MTWTKLGGELLDLAEDLSPTALATYVELLMLSNRRGLDLLIPAAKLARLPHPPTDEVLRELETAGLIERRDDEAVFAGLWRPEWQQSAAVVEHTRNAAALRQQRKRAHDAGDHSLCTDRCSALSRRDGGRDDTRDPARYGTARHGPENGLEETSSHPRAYDPADPWSDSPVVAPGSRPMNTWRRSGGAA